MKYVCNHCQETFDLDVAFPHPIPCGVCGQGTLIEDEKYRENYWWRKCPHCGFEGWIISVCGSCKKSYYSGKSELARLREETKLLKDQRQEGRNLVRSYDDEVQRLKNAISTIRTAINGYDEVGSIVVDICNEIIDDALNAEHGGE